MLCLLCWLDAQADISMSATFGDHMVLQAGVAVPVWGKGTEGENVKVTFDGNAGEQHVTREQTTRINADAHWKLQLDPLPTGVVGTLTVTAHNTLTFTDVLAGEVWLASGQSNMGMLVAHCADATEEMANAKYPSIRFFNVPHQTLVTPVDWLTSGHWEVCTPQTVWALSGVAYYFARALHQSRNVPVGMIVSAVGGTAIAPWLNRDTARILPELAGEVEQDLDQIAHFPVKWPAYLSHIKTWNAVAEKKNEGLTAKWFSPDVSDADWARITLPQEWQKTNDEKLRAFHGVLWLRKTLAIPDFWQGQPLTLSLAEINDFDDVYLNGVRVCGTSYEPRGANHQWRQYTIPASAVHAGQENLLAVCVSNPSGNGGIVASWEPLQIAPRDIFPVPEGKQVQPISLRTE